MTEAQNSKINFIKTKIPNLDENKLKSLEARFIGPSSNGTMPIQYEPLIDIDVELLKSSKNINDNLII